MKKRTTKRKKVDTPTTRKRNAGEARLRQHGENNIRKGKGIKNKDGSVSSVRSTSVRTKSGKEMLVPTVYDGKQVSAPEAKKRALKAEKAGGAKYPRYRSAQKATIGNKVEQYKKNNVISTTGGK